MNIRIRFVPFGTSFKSSIQGDQQEGLRTDLLSPATDVLCTNEVVVDVGGICYGHIKDEKRETRLVFDHHFDRGPDNYPSASSAVLHHAADVVKELASRATRYPQFAENPNIWIVTHKFPDFDALCAAYLLRSLFEMNSTDSGNTGRLPLLESRSFAGLGLSTCGWRDVPDSNGKVRRRIDWFNPDIPQDHPARWAILLAAYAACVDNGKRISAPRPTRLHSVLYAAMQRGRETATDGLRRFFDVARCAVSEHRLNPLFDSIFADSSEFAPELRLLANEERAYVRDIRRARRTLVTLQVGSDFSSWYDSLCDERLLIEKEGSGTEFQINPCHLEGPQSKDYRQVDGIFLRDPECLLFKEWAREDADHSISGDGFLFTAIAYSGGRPKGEVNQSDYFFALDPERAQGAHLYDVWAVLQQQECARLPRTMPEAQAREKFEGRAGLLVSLFNDPWFDGSNYKGTIVATPDRGSAIPGGSASDLSDDTIVQIVTSRIEFRAFVGSVDIWDYFPDPNRRLPLRIKKSARNGPRCDLPPDSFRFGEVKLDSRIDLADRALAVQIGYQLWPFLEPAGVSMPPADFIERHLIVYPARMVVVWSRRGIICGYQEAGRAATRDLQEKLEEFSKLAAELRYFQADVTAPGIQQKSFELLERTVKLRIATAMPEGGVLRRFVEAKRLDELAKMLYETNDAIRSKLEADRAKEQANRDKKQTYRLTLIAIVISALALPNLFLNLNSKNASGWERRLLSGAQSHPFEFEGSVALVAIGLICVLRRQRLDEHSDH
jgi:hypothetical protein